MKPKKPWECLCCGKKNPTVARHCMQCGEERGSGDPEATDGDLEERVERIEEKLDKVLAGKPAAAPAPAATSKKKRKPSDDLMEVFEDGDEEDGEDGEDEDGEDDGDQ